MWTYDQILDTQINDSGKYIVRVQLANEDQVRTEFFQFSVSPTEEEVVVEVNKYLAHLNE